MRGGRKIIGGGGQSSGPNDPRGRRDMQQGVSAQFPAVVRGNEVSVQINPRGALAVDPALGIGVNVGEGLEVSSQSPYAIRPVLGEGLEVRGGRIHPRTSSSVRLSARGQLVATPSTMEVTDPDDGTAYASLARKANVADSRFPKLRGSVDLVAGAVTVVSASAVSDDIVLLSTGVVAGTQGMLSSTVSDGGGYLIQSSEAGDTSQVHYVVWSA